MLSAERTDSAVYNHVVLQTRKHVHVWNNPDLLLYSNDDDDGICMAACYRYRGTSVDGIELSEILGVSGATGIALDLRSAGRGFKSYSLQKLRNNLGQVVHTHVPLSPSSITWYRPRHGDALRLGR